MSYYLIRYLDPQAKKKQIEFEGNTKLDAIENSGINPDQILSVSLAIHFGSQDLSLDVQELILSEVRALARSGQAMNKGLTRILKRSGISKKAVLGIASDDGKTISKIFSDIGMSKAVVAVVGAGESSSRLDSALDNTLIYIQSQKKIQNQVKAPFTEGIIIVSLALIMIMVLPTIVAPALEILTAGELNIETNFMTDLLIYINTNNGIIWIVMLSIVVLVFIARKYIWSAANNMPGLANINEFFILKRSVLLLMILRPLFESGIPLNKSLNIIKNSMSSNADIKAMQSLIDRMAIGESLSRSITNPEHWSPIFYNSFASFEQAVIAAQLELIDTVTHALLSRLSIITGKISSSASILGKLLGFFALLMLVLGYYFPSLTASVS